MTGFRFRRPALLLLLITVVLAGCAFGIQLKTETADPKTISGIYDLYLYGCRYPDDIEHVALLIAPDKAGTVELYVPASSYKVKQGLPADQALAEANAHVRCGTRSVQDIRLHRIPDGAGGTLGYEILPRYPFSDQYGMDRELFPQGRQNRGLYQFEARRRAAGEVPVLIGAVRGAVWPEDVASGAVV